MRQIFCSYYKTSVKITIRLQSVYKVVTGIDPAKKWCYTFSNENFSKGETVMKAKFITAVIFSAMLLTACNSETQMIDDIETSGTTVTPQPVQVVQAGTSSEESESGTSYILGGDTETAVSVTETTAETTAETEPVTEPALETAKLNVQKIDVSGIAAEDERLSDGLFVSGDIAAIKCYGNDSDEIRFFDVNDLSVKASVTAPEGWEFDNDFLEPCIEGSGDVLCKIKLKRFDSEKLNDEYAALIIHNDFTTELAEGEPRFTLSFPAGSHNISDMMYDIVDADSGAILVEGFQDTEHGAGFGDLSLWHDYKFQIDSESFVYRICGNERVPGFGYYDYNAGAATEFPESKDFFPVGYHDGKVYAEQGVWDGMCQGELYAFDIETLESEHFMSSPVELENNDYTEYYMPPNGSYLIASVHDDDNEDYSNSKNIVFIISIDSGEVLAQQEFGSEYNDLRFFRFIDDNRFAAFNYNTNEVVIFDVTE